jgi:hypothetical protein
MLLHQDYDLILHDYGIGLDLMGLQTTVSLNGISWLVVHGYGVG